MTKRGPFRVPQGLTGQEKKSETKAPHNHHLFSFSCQINFASPATEMAFPSPPDTRCFFISCQRNLLFYLLGINMSHLLIRPFIQPQYADLESGSLISWWQSKLHNVQNADIKLHLMQKCVRKHSRYTDSSVADHVTLLPFGKEVLNSSLGNTKHKKRTF